MTTPLHDNTVALRETLHGLLCGLLVLFLASCQTLPSTANQRPITHVVLCWLRTPGDAEARRRLIETSLSFKQIPGVIEVGTGTSLPSPRKEVDSSFDLAVTIIFENKKALREFVQHPIHQRAAKEVLIPLVKKRLIYDIASD